MMFLLLAVLVGSFGGSSSESWLPNSCRELSDGYHWLKFIDGEQFPAVYLLCSNGYAILDYNQDSNIYKYFDSWQQWHLHTYGPTNEFSLNWQEWFLPDVSQMPPNHLVTKSHLDVAPDDFTFRQDTSEDDYYDGDSGVKSSLMNYLISPDCSSCDEDNSRQLYDTSTTYWMTGTLFGCSWVVKATYKCNVDIETDTCNVCHEDHSDLSEVAQVHITDESSIYDFSATGVCPHNVRKAYNYVVPFHDECLLDQSGTREHLKPSIGVSGQYCVCVQPTTETLTYLVHESEQELEEMSRDKASNIEKENNVNDADDNEMVDIKLYQKDFEKGTYRIRQSGKYTIMEDILFDFKSNENDPNSVGAYWPTVDDNVFGEYPGAGDVRDHYFMGFFAGITIECNDVTLDLNGHTLSMSDYFYYQQRWFTIIELTTQYFLPGQGIGNFGASPVMAQNVQIKNGILGLTSHHGIHGNYNKNVRLSDLVVREFETHGIQFNGFDGIYMDNIEVGPTSNKVRFTGEYAHMRGMLPRYRILCDELDDVNDRILFDGRTESLSMCDIASEIELEMDMAFDYVTKGKSYSAEEDGESLYESFVSAMRLFVNSNDAGSVPYGSAQFGIFLNTFDASVLTYSLYTPFVSENARLNNIKIHDLTHSMREYIRIQRPSTGDFVMNPFAGPLNAEEMFVGFDKTDRDSLDRSNLRYKGNIVLDSFIAMNYLSDHWGYLQMQIVGNNFIVPWAMGTNYDRITGDTMSLGCNMDVMIHSGKGINGLRLDGVTDVEITNIEIYNLYDLTPLGSTMCGAYQGTNCNECGNDGGHFRQTAPMQMGFSGNMNQGININSATDITIENAYIHDLVSATGPAYGISIWPSCDVTLKGDINVNGLSAGSQVESGSLTYDDMPNQAPETCGIRVVWEYKNNDNYDTNVAYDDAVISTRCLEGHVGCLGEDDVQSAPTMIGDFNSDESECTNQISVKLVNNNNNNNNNNNMAGHSHVKDNSITWTISKILTSNVTMMVILFLVFGVILLVKNGKLIVIDDHKYSKIEDIETARTTYV